MFTRDYRIMTLALFVLSFVNCFAYYGLLIITPGARYVAACARGADFLATTLSAAADSACRARAGMTAEGT